MSLIFIHGRDQQLYAEDDLKVQWTAALAKGATAAGLNVQSTILAEPICLPYYATTLVDLIRRSNKQKAAEVKRAAQGARSFAVEFVGEALGRVPTVGAEAENIRPADVLRGVARGGPDTERSIQNATWVLTLARFLDRSATEFSASLIDTILEDVGIYLTVASVRKEIDQIVREQVERTKEPRVVVAHSLGSIVAYNVLRASPHLAVERLITVGSPLGTRAVLSRLTPHEVLQWPMGVRSWMNASDHRDIVALQPRLDRSSVFKRVPTGAAKDRCDVWNITDIDNHTENRHGIAGYLDDPIVARALLTSAKIAGSEI